MVSKPSSRSVAYANSPVVVPVNTDDLPSITASEESGGECFVPDELDDIDRFETKRRNNEPVVAIKEEE